MMGKAHEGISQCLHAEACAQEKKGARANDNLGLLCLRHTCLLLYFHRDKNTKNNPNEKRSRKEVEGTRRLQKRVLKIQEIQGA